jgi:hypothetical protein
MAKVADRVSAIDVPVLTKRDYAGRGASAGDKFFKQIGEIGKKIKEGTPASADAVNTQDALHSFADRIDRNLE